MIVGNRQHNNADILLWVHFLPQLKFTFSPILNWPSQHSFQASFLSNSLQIEWFCVCMWREQGLLDIWNALISLIFEPTCNWKMSSTLQTKEAAANKSLFKQKKKDTLWFWNGMFGNTRITQEASTQTERVMREDNRGKEGGWRRGQVRRNKLNYNLQLLRHVILTVTELTEYYQYLC